MNQVEEKRAHCLLDKNELDVAWCLLEKEEEEKLIEHCLELQIDENIAQIHDREIVEIQDPEEVNVK